MSARDRLLRSSTSGGTPGGGYITNPQGIARYRAKLANAAAVPVKIWALGDSIVWGVGWDGGSTATSETDGRLYSWPSVLGRNFADQFASTDGSFLESVGAVGSDPLVTAVSAPVVSSIGLARCTRSVNTTGPGTLTFVLPECTAFDIIYWESDGTNSNPNTGSFQYTIDGGGAVAVADASTPAAYKVVSVTGLSAASHTIVITGTTAQLAYIAGVTYRDVKGVAVGRFGRPGATVKFLLGETDQSAAGQVRLLLASAMGTPDLVIVQLGTNDCMQQFNAPHLTTPAVFKAKVKSICDTVSAAGGDVFLLCEPEPPYAQPEGGAPFSAYRAAMKEIAQVSAHVTCADINDRWGGPTAAIANGLQNIGSVHPTIAGYQDMGDWVHELIG